MRRLISSMVSRARQFAPLKEGAPSSAHLPKLKGVVFDVDGTLCEPQNYMFGEMRSALHIDKGTDILEHIYSLPTPESREEAMESIRSIERTAMASQKPQPGLVELMRYLDTKNIPKGICTRNFDAPVNHLLTKFLSSVKTFEPIVTREFRPPKPDPAGILHIARNWGLTRPSAHVEADNGNGSAVVGHKVTLANGGEVRDEVVTISTGDGKDETDATGLIMVGDSIDDITAGRRAGAATVLLVNPANRHLAEHENTDLVIERLDELIGVLEHGFKGREI